MQNCLPGGIRRQRSIRRIWLHKLQRKIRTVAGSSDDSSCKNCSGGRFQTNEGSTRCQKSDPGRSGERQRALLVLRGWKASGDEGCLDRPSGWFQSDQEQPECKECDPVAAVNGGALPLLCTRKVGRGCRDCPRLPASRRKRTAPCLKGTTTNGRTVRPSARLIRRQHRVRNDADAGRRSGQHRVRRVPPAKLLIRRARRARTRLGLRRRIALSTSTDDKRTSRSGAAKLVPRACLSGGDRVSKSNKLPSRSDGQLPDQQHFCHEQRGQREQRGGMSLQGGVSGCQQSGAVRQVQGRSCPRGSERVVQRSVPRISVRWLRARVQPRRWRFVRQVRRVPRSSRQLCGGWHGRAARGLRHLPVPQDDAERRRDERRVRRY